MTGPAPEEVGDVEVGDLGGNGSATAPEVGRFALLWRPVLSRSAVLREELSYGRSKIIAMLNEEMGREVVKEVVLR